MITGVPPVVTAGSRCCWGHTGGLVRHLELQNWLSQWSMQQAQAAITKSSSSWMNPLWSIFSSTQDAILISMYSSQCTHLFASFCNHRIAWKKGETSCDLEMFGVHSSGPSAARRLLAASRGISQARAGCQWQSFLTQLYTTVVIAWYQLYNAVSATSIVLTSCQNNSVDSCNCVCGYVFSCIVCHSKCC